MSSTISFDFADKAVIVTGVSSGIGLATALLLLDSRARVLGAAEQAEPQLFAGERGQQRVGEIIDLDQVFEFQVLLPSGQGGSLPARPAHGTTSVAPHPAR